MADKFWVADALGYGTGNWTDDTNHWALTSGGLAGAGNLPIPGVDSVHFDQNSSTTPLEIGGYIVNADVNIDVVDLMHDAAATSGGTLFILATTTAITLTVRGNTKILLGSGVSFGGGVSFISALVGNTIDLNGSSLMFASSTGNPNTSFSGGGTWNFLSDTGALAVPLFNTTGGDVLVHDAHLVTNGHALSSGALSLAGAEVKSLDFGASIWSVTKNGTVFTGGGINTTIPAHTGYIKSTNVSGAGVTFSPGSQSVGNAVNVWATALGQNTFGAGVHGDVSFAGATNTFRVASPITIAGGLALPATVTRSISSAITFSPPAGKISDLNVSGTLGSVATTFNGAGVIRLLANFASSGASTMTKAALDRNGFSFVTQNLNLAVGVNRVQLWGNWGVPTLTYGENIDTNPVEIITATSGAITGVDFTGFSHQWYLAAAFDVSGTFILGVGMTSSAGTINLKHATSATHQINGNECTLAADIHFLATVGSPECIWELLGGLHTTGRAYVARGIIDSGGFDLSAGGGWWKEGGFPSSLGSMLAGTRVRLFIDQHPGQIITGSGEVRFCPGVTDLTRAKLNGALDMSAFTGSITEISDRLQLTGDVTLNAAMLWPYTGATEVLIGDLTGASPLVAITTNGVVIGDAMTVNGASVVALGSPLTLDDPAFGIAGPSTFGLAADAKFRTQGFDMYARDISFDSSILECVLGASIITCTAAFAWSGPFTGAGRIDAGTSIIRMINSQQLGAVSFDGGVDQHYNIVQFDTTLDLFNPTVSFNSITNFGLCTINEIRCPNLPGVLHFDSGQNTIVGILPSGQPGTPLTITSSGIGGNFIVTALNGVTSVHDVILSNSTGAPEGSWSAGRTSVDGGGNINWVFGDIFIGDAVDTLALTDVTDLGPPQMAGSVNEALSLVDVAEAYRLAPPPPSQSKYPHNCNMALVYGSGVFTRAPAMDVVHEKSVAWLEVTFVDKNGAADSPEAITYSVLEGDTRAVIHARTQMPVGSQLVIVLSQADNTLASTLANAEVRLVTVEASFRDGEKINQELRYELVRVPGADI